MPRGTEEVRILTGRVVSQEEDRMARLSLYVRCREEVYGALGVCVEAQDFDLSV